MPADPDRTAEKTLKAIAKSGRLRRREVDEAALRTAMAPDPSWVSAAIVSDQDDIKTWLALRKVLFGPGRGPELSKAGQRRVWHDAAGRCMFRGCGSDLGVTALTSEAAAAGYLAHIVASHPGGPRGNDAESETLSADPDNIMLMCDAHHRLIDRIDPDGYSVEVLRDMRREHVASVRGYLDALAFPRSKALAVFGNVAGIWTHAPDRDIRQAVLQRRLMCLPELRYPMRHTQRDDRDRPDFWRHLLHQHQPELDAFMRELGNPDPRESYDVLSIFPLHSVPLLFLLGRVVGEARQVEVFQYHRERRTWCWDSNATAKPGNACFVDGLADSHTEEVLLSIELTAAVDENALPSDLKAAVGAGKVPWIRIRAIEPSSAWVAHPNDLEQFTGMARRVVAAIQDRLHATKVHLIGIAPASALFRFGQLLQAGHHCPYVVYDRPNFTTPFTTALTIDGRHATDAMPAGAGQPTTILLR
jgi:hypothetical protein